MKYPGTVNGNGTQPHISTAEEWRKRKVEQARGKAVPLTLPSGVIVKIVRPSLSAWFGTAKLPETLSKNVLAIFGGTEDANTESKIESKVNKLSEQEQTDIVGFMNMLIMEAIIEPQIVDKKPEECGKGEFALADLDDEERGFILYAIMSGVPDQPVPVADGGEVSVEQLGKFRDTKRGTGTRKTRRKVPRTTK